MSDRGARRTFRHAAWVPLVVAVGVVIAVAAAGGSAAVPAGERTVSAGCEVFPAATGVAADAPSLPDQRAWNQDISGAPVDPSSDAIIGYINSHGDNVLHPDFGSNPKYGIPYKTVGKKAKRVKVKFTAYGSESDHGKYRIPLSAKVEGGANADGDRHVIGFDKSRCLSYELYRAFPDRKRNRWKAEGGAIWDLSSPALRTEGWTSADAAGLPIFPGLVRYDEVAAGSVDHAIRVTFESTRNAWINPASHCAGDTDNPAAPPMGIRFRLKASYDISGLSGQARVIAEAMKRYGLINADNGSNWYFQGGSDRRWNDGELNGLKEIPGTAFEVVRSEAPVHVC